MDTGAKLSLNRFFYDEKWTKGRCVTCMDHSLQHPELLAASYNNNEDLPHEPDGVVLVWNTKFKKTTPESVVALCFVADSTKRFRANFL